MINRPLPGCERRRREIIFQKAYRRMVVATGKILTAHDVPADDPELTVSDLSIDAALGSALAYDALYWQGPTAFSARSDDYLTKFVVRCAAIAVDGEVSRVLQKRAILAEQQQWSDRICGGIATQRIEGFQIFQPA
jgi:hypothetical protein